MPILQVVKGSDAAAFAQKWTNNGVAIFMDATHHKFAADFANIVITSFVEQQQAKAAAAAKAKKIALTDADDSPSQKV